MKFPPRRIINALLVGGFAAWLLAWKPFSDDIPADPCQLELTVASPAAATLRLRIDEGHGYPHLLPSLSVRIPPLPVPSTFRLPIPPGRIRGLQLNVSETPSLAVHSARLCTTSDRTLAVFPAGTFRPAADASATVDKETVVLRPAQAGGRAFGFELVPRSPIIVASGNEPSLGKAFWSWLAASAVIFMVSTLLSGRLGGAQRAWQELKGMAQRRPRLALAIIALAGAVASSYPVVFLGKSFVSPNSEAYLLYFRYPTLPDAQPEIPEDVKGSDVGAIMWCHVPYTALVSRALFRDGELPLWNRYNCAGAPLLGQAQSMVGDPLGMIALLTESAWWAWDVKFVLAKAIFALGLALCVLTLTRSLGLAAVTAMSAVWIGFFAFRFAHVATFSVAYGPWILLPWLALRNGGSRRDLLRAGIGLFLANWVQINSGTAKESSMLILCLNATGLLVLLCSAGTWRERVRRIAPLLWANTLFLLISAPLWLVFFDALRRSITVYDAPRALQLPASLLLGFFDDIFTQDFTRTGHRSHPSLNFFLLTGFLWFLAAGLWRKNRMALALSLACLPLAALVFGVVPPTWIAATPLLGNIVHVHNTFGCVLLILVPLLAAIGLHDAWERRGTTEWTAIWRRMLAVLALLLAAYLSFTQAEGQAPYARFHLDPTWRSLFFLRYAPVLLLAAALLPWLLRRQAWPAVVLALFAMHFRHGMYVATKFDEYVMNPRTGYPLEAQSMAVQRIRHRLVREPFRTVGFSGNLSPGYNALIGLESIAGSDALMNRHYHELCRSGNLERIDWRIIVRESTIPATKPFHDLLNLRYYLRAPTTLPEPAGLFPVGNADLQILESREAWPRAFFTNRVKTYATVEELAALVRSGDGRPFAARQESPLPTEAGDEVIPASDYRLTTNRTSFTVHATGPGIAVLGETFEEGNFRLTVNGQPAPYFRVNHAFKGVALDSAGDYRIVFTYWPRVLTPALWLAGIGLVLGAGTAFLLWRQPAGATPTPSGSRPCQKEQPVEEDRSPAEARCS